MSGSTYLQHTNRTWECTPAKQRRAEESQESMSFPPHSRDGTTFRGQRTTAAPKAVPLGRAILVGLGKVWRRLHVHGSVSIKRFIVQLCTASYGLSERTDIVLLAALARRRRRLGRWLWSGLRSLERRVRRGLGRPRLVLVHALAVAAGLALGALISATPKTILTFLPHLPQFELDLLRCTHFWYQPRPLSTHPLALDRALLTPVGLEALAVLARCDARVAGELG